MSPGSPARPAMWRTACGACSKCAGRSPPCACKRGLRPRGPRAPGRPGTWVCIPFVPTPWPLAAPKPVPAEGFACYRSGVPVRLIVLPKDRASCHFRHRPLAGYATPSFDKVMKPAPAKTPRIVVALVENDPLRLVGFRSLFDKEPEFELTALEAHEVRSRENLDVALLGSRNGQNLFDMIAGLKAARPDLRILVTGSGADDETILKALAAGAKGYIDEGADPGEFAQALKVVFQGWVWAPRRVLAMFVDRVAQSGRIFPAGRLTFTDREKEVLELLVAGRSNKEIGSALGIEERTVKAHVAKLMRKVGVQNRIALSVHAITHSLVTNK